LLTKNALASMRLPVCLVALGLFFWSWPNVAAAQTTTRDGVQALLRGDYQTAARILRPLAEDSAQPDPVAQFFMATLYASGNGVPRSDLKACGLYLSASTPANPLMNQALELVRTFQEQSVRASVQLCTPIRADDYGQLPSASFDLGPDHRITMDRSGATISYRGTQGQAHWDMGGAGWVFLPPQHVELIVSRPVTATRHFILFFVWWPEASDRSVWSLGWILHEAIGPDLPPVTGEKRLTTLAAPQPPASFDVESVAGVRLNQSGEAEWFISTGSHPRSAVIPFKEPR
jgi:hypothetical protein